MSLEYSHTEQIVLHFEGISNTSTDWHTWIRQLVTISKLIKQLLSTLPWLCCCLQSKWELESHLCLIFFHVLLCPTLWFLLFFFETRTSFYPNHTYSPHAESYTSSRLLSGHNLLQEMLGFLIKADPISASSQYQTSLKSRFLFSRLYNLSVCNF